MPDNPINKRHRMLRILIGEGTVSVIIALNAIAMFVGGFPGLPEWLRTFCNWVDYSCVVFFVVEAVIKIGRLGFRVYWSRGWNRVDFMIVLFCMPLLFQPPMVESTLGAFAIAPLLRLGRFLRFIRLMKFIPNAKHLWEGTKRALRASIGVFVVLFLLNLILAMGANLLFGRKYPEYFGDPLTANYTLFKVFTIEGWHEIPDKLAENPDTSRWEIVLLRGYFVVSVLVGGILGLSLANAVFVDEMMTDNNDMLERQVRELHTEIKAMRDELRESRREQRN